MDMEIMCQWMLFNLGLYSLTSIEPLRGLDALTKHPFFVEIQGVKRVQEL